MDPPPRWLKLAPCLILAGIVYRNVSAQILPFEHYTSANGLLSNATTALFQDSRGYMHIGSAEGINTFDGYSFSHTRTKDGLPSNFINSLNELPSTSGILWVCTNNGLAKRDGNRITVIQVDTTTLSRLVYAVEEDATQQLWCATRDGLYTIRNSVITKVSIPYMDGHPHAVLKPGPDSLVWVAMSTSLLAFTPDRAIRHRVRLSSSPINHVTSAFRDRSGTIWVGLMDSTLLQYRDTVLVHSRRIRAGRVLHMMQDNEGGLQSGTENGVLSLSSSEFLTGAFERIGPENGLPGRRVNGGVVDTEGDIWFSCDGAGVAKLTTSGLHVFPIPDIPQAYNNMRAASDTAGHYWVPSGRSLIEVWKTDEQGWHAAHNFTGGELGKEIHGIVCDSRNRLWLTFAGKEIRTYSIHYNNVGKSELRLLDVSREGDLRGRPRMLTGDRQGRRLWTDSSHLHVQHQKMTRRYSLTDLVGETDVRTLFVDNKGNIWVGGYSKGIAMIHGDSLDAPPRRFAPHRDIPAGFVRAFCEDRFGRIWVGTRYSGCMILGEGGITTLSTTTVLPSDVVWTIARDSSSLMWLGTAEGFIAIDPATLLPDPIGNDIVRNAVVSSGVSRQGMLWYVTQTGLGLIDRARLRAPSSTVNVSLVRIEIDGRPVNISGALAFAHDQNNCVFTFRPSTLRNTRDILYEYRLVGGDNTWQTPTRDRSVSYAALRPGNYRFEVRAARVGAGAFGPTASVLFSISPPFWEEWWFRSAVVCAVGAFAFIVYRRRVSALEREKKLQREFSHRLMEYQESERKRIAGELHDSLVQNLLVAKNRSLMGLKNMQDSEKVGRELEEISSALGTAIDEVREIAHNLRPYQLDRMGFSKAVRSLVSKLAESTQIRFEVYIEDVDRDLHETTTIHLYRIAQEALNNVLNHSGAASASLTLKRVGEWVELSIRDEGKGMPVEVTTPTGFGLDGIAHRVGLMQGTFEISSQIGTGTLLRIRIPVVRSEDGEHDFGSHRR